MKARYVARGIWAGGLWLALALPYIKPLVCGAVDSPSRAGHAHTGAPAPVGDAWRMAVDQSVCHVLGSCAVAFTGPVLAAGSVLPMPGAEAAAVPARPDALHDTPAAPGTPPPRV